MNDTARTTPPSDPLPATQESATQRDDAPTSGGGGPAPEPGAPFAAEVAGHEILGVLGRGGMGVVYKARQRGLNRVVALKMVLAAEHAGAEQLARFRAEAEAVARLQHPHIVQVFEVGEVRGHPYFSLEYVEGGSLAQKLNGTPLPPSEAGRLVETLARAVHAAHLRGVVHRDLKPANVLLTAEGTPKITDFGLAKRLDVETAHTQSGAILGTPSYMAPEQAEGKVHAVGPTADVYALGAILYELLTGRPPFKAASPLDTVLQVLSEEPVPVRRLQPKVPRDLETVCLTCLRKEPAKRYATALDLADDLHRWLAGEPIRARPTPAWEQAVKWARRRPAAAALLAVVAAAGVGLVLATVALTAANRREHAARVLAQENGLKAEQERDRARDRFRMAQDAVDQFYTRVSASPEMKAQGTERLRTELLETAARFYEKFVKDQGDDLALQAECGRGYVRLAQLYHATGRAPQAEAAFKDALALQKRLAQAEPDQVQYQLDLAASYRGLGGLYRDTSRKAQAEAAYCEALAISQRVADAHPDVEDYQQRKASDQEGLGTLYFMTGEYGPSEKASLAALAVKQRLADAHPERRDYQTTVAGGYSNLASLYVAMRRPGPAEEAAKKALTIWERLAGADPQPLDAQEAVARCHNTLGCLYVDTERFKLAESAHRKALVVHQALAKTHPEVLGYAIDVGGSYANLGRAALISGANSAALDWYSKAARTLDEVLRKEPRQTRARQFLANTRAGRAVTLTQLGRYAESLPDWDRAIELDNGQDRNHMRLGRADALARTGEYARAADEMTDVGKDEALGQELYEQAVVWAQIAAAARRDAKLSPADRDHLADRHAARAVVLLTRAGAAGQLRDKARVEQVRTEKDLDPLRDREDFRKLRAGLGPPAAGGGKK
jgi:serine/threonine-protein kinase